MSDTLQIVYWALEKTCALRNGDQAKSPVKARGAVGRARAYSDSLRNKERRYGIFGDVFVTGYTYGYRPVPENEDSSSVGGFLNSEDFQNLIGHRRDSKKSLPTPLYPNSGFIISEEFKNLGGPTTLFEMCGACPANITRNGIAGCCGFLRQWPAFRETEDYIRGIISRLGLEREVEEAFPRTTLLWFGLWAQSPLPTQSLRLLRTIISAMQDEGPVNLEHRKKVSQQQLQEIALFAKAAEVAEQQNIPLHVTLTPPGHSDFGWHTIFPHCPFCKAEARIKRWQRKYPTALYECQVCGRKYSPAETEHSQREDEEREGLRELLGPARFLEFAREYIMARGETCEDADAIIRETEAREEARLEKVRQMQELNRKRRSFLEKKILKGLETMTPPPSHHEDDEPTAKQERWYSSDVFMEVLNRCETQGVLVTYMIHDSADGETDRTESAPVSKLTVLQELPAHIANPRQVLSNWKREGCNGKFYASYVVPEKLVR